MDEGRREKGEEEEERRARERSLGNFLGEKMVNNLLR